jgi:hypothetical protein
MPPGMIMDRNTPAAAMRDMAAVDPRDVVARYGLDVRGDRDLVPRVENGVKVFDLETAVIRRRSCPASRSTLTPSTAKFLDPGCGSARAIA